MSLTFKYIPLTFQNDKDEIKRQIRNTIILKYIFKTFHLTENLGNLVDGTQYGYNDSAKTDGTNKFLRISDIKNGVVDWDTVPYCNCDDEETYLLKSKDTLIARTGGTTGKSFMISNPPKHSVFAGYLIRIRANEENNSDYINLFLNSYAYWSQITSLNEDNFRPRVNATALKSLIVPICDSKVQIDAVKISKGKYVENYESIYEELEQLEKCNQLEIEYNNAINQIENLKQAIIQDAFELNT